MSKPTATTILLKTYKTTVTQYCIVQGAKVT